jgi:hypothetical protein
MEAYYVCRYKFEMLQGRFSRKPVLMVPCTACIGAVMLLIVSAVVMLGIARFLKL